MMTVIGYEKGLHRITDHVYTYLQPDGGWGLNNAGLVVGGDDNCLIDTLYDLELTGEFIDSIKKQFNGFTMIKQAVNTHSNGDHFYGNALLNGATIITSERCRQEMMALPPKRMHMLLSIYFLFGKAGKFLRECFSRYHFKNIPLVLPEKTFNEQAELTVGSTNVRLLEFNDIHTGSDIMVHIPEEKVLFASDLLFIGGMPISWGGKVTRWIQVMDNILAMDVDYIVPGHGPLTDKEGVKEFKSLLQYIYGEAEKSFQRGISLLAASTAISLANFSDMIEKEKIVTLVYSVFKELNPRMKPISTIKLFGLMAEYKKHRNGFIPNR